MKQKHPFFGNFFMFSHVWVKSSASSQKILHNWSFVLLLTPITLLYHYNKTKDWALVQNAASVISKKRVVLEY